MNENQMLISLQEFGAKKNTKTTEKSVATHFRQTAIDSKYGLILHHLALFMKAKYILELGTSLGMSTLYLSLGAPKGQIMTIDAQKSTMDCVKELFVELNSTNTRFILGNFDDILEETLSHHEVWDLCFLDGNHSYEPTLNYFNIIKAKMSPHSAIVLDDIRWSPDMYRAWEELREDISFNYSIDLGRIGILFRIDNQSPKQHFYIK